jgi:hypothetical protein
MQLCFDFQASAVYFVIWLTQRGCRTSNLLTPWLYDSLRALASLITDTHSSLPIAFCSHLLTFISYKSFCTFSSHFSSYIFFPSPLFSNRRPLLGFLKIWLFSEVRSIASRANPQPLWHRYPFFICVTTFDLSGKGDPISSYATARIALRIIWPHKPHHQVNVWILLVEVCTSTYSI